MGKCIAECMIRLSLFYWDPFSFFQESVDASLACEFPIAPMGDSRVACCLQGGGVYVSSGTVTIMSSSITGNTASGDVRAYVQNFPSPQWECLADNLALAFQPEPSYMFYQGWVRSSHACKTPSPQWENC